MDPILIVGLLAAAVFAAAFVITKLVLLTASWLKNKLKSRLSGKKVAETVAINGDKLKEILADVASQTDAIPVNDLDMLLFDLDAEGQIENIEFVETEQGLDAAAETFMDRSNNVIRITA